MYYYIRSRRSGEIVQVRLDLNQLSPEYETIASSLLHPQGRGRPAQLRADGRRFQFRPEQAPGGKEGHRGEFVTREEWLASSRTACAEAIGADKVNPNLLELTEPRMDESMRVCISRK
jgi:hypothetical protein